MSNVGASGSGSLGRGRGRVARKQESGRKGEGDRVVPYSLPAGRSGPRPDAAPPASYHGYEEPAGRRDVVEKKFESMAIDGNGNGNGNGGGSFPIGRGGTRGRRVIPVMDILTTKPEVLATKKGEYGVKVDLTTNYFKLETVTDWVLYQYRVDFSVVEDRERVLRAWLAQHRTRLNTAYIFDGTMMFTSQRLTASNEPLELTSIREDGEPPVQITIKFIQQLKYGNAVYLQVFNILVRRCLMHLNLQLVNRNYFDPKASIHLRQHFLEIWPGYLTSIRQHEKHILMCAEIAHKVMRTDTALQVLSECTRESSDWKRLFQQTMIGAIVLTDYNNKTYRVDDVDFSLTPESKFEYKNSEQMSYVDYYQMRYKIRIRDLKQPLLISRSSARDVRAGKDRQCLLVPELCRMTGLTNRMLENRNLMKDLAGITRVPADERINRLNMFNQRLQNEKEVAADLSRWQMKLSNKLVTLQGRELPPEKIIAANSKTFYPEGQDMDWTRGMRNQPMLTSGRFQTFVVICPYRLRNETQGFLNVLHKSANGMQFKIPQPIFLDTRSDGPADMLEAVETVLGKYRPDMILFAFTSNRADRYSAVKKKCYVDRGIPSQVILARNLTSKGVMSIATKVVVQINAKIGGIPWTVPVPSGHIMVVGYDVCHDKSKKSKSVGAVVASLNQTMSAWFSAVSFHTSGEELSDTLSFDVCKAIRKYRELNGNVLPQKIVVYRDGVGEGQINYVYQHEVEMLKKRLTELYGGETWKLCFIIVTKRIKTRFFNKGRNPRPGTIVDDVVTLPERYDFYLISQSVRQGTVSPTSYNVISDNVGWSPDQIQRFTYKMTHLYYNCSATVGVPAPCQYAHKLAFLVSQNLHAEPHPNLDTRLYFL